MKEIKKFLLMLAAVTVSMALTTGCSNSDDEEEDEVTLGEQVEGIYKGTYTVEDLDLEDEIEVVVIRTGETRADFRFGEMVFEDLGSVTIGQVSDIDLTGVTSRVGVAKIVDNFTVQGQFGELVEMFTVNIEMSGTIRTGTAMNLELRLTSDDDPLGSLSPLVITVAADKEDDDE